MPVDHLEIVQVVDRGPEGLQLPDRFLEFRGRRGTVDRRVQPDRDPPLLARCVGQLLRAWSPESQTYEHEVRSRALTHLAALLYGSSWN